jgi:hypothetical protein
MSERYVVNPENNTGVPTWNTVSSPEQAEAARKAEHAMLEKARLARLEREAKIARQREAATVAEAQARLEDYEGQQHQAFIHGGGSESDWSRTWPKIRERFLLDQMTEPQRKIEAEVKRLIGTGQYPRF